MTQPQDEPISIPTREQIEAAFKQHLPIMDKAIRAMVPEVQDVSADSGHKDLQEYVAHTLSNAVLDIQVPKRTAMRYPDKAIGLLDEIITSLGKNPSSKPHVRLRTQAELEFYRAVRLTLMGVNTDQSVGRGVSP